MVLFLDSQHRLIAAEELFRGTLAQTSVYPREVVKAALKHNAAAVIQGYIQFDLEQLRSAMQAVEDFANASHQKGKCPTFRNKRFPVPAATIASSIPQGQSIAGLHGGLVISGRKHSPPQIL